MEDTPLMGAVGAVRNMHTEKSLEVEKKPWRVGDRVFKLRKKVLWNDCEEGTDNYLK